MGCYLEVKFLKGSVVIVQPWRGADAGKIATTYVTSCSAVLNMKLHGGSLTERSADVYACKESFGR